MVAILKYKCLAYLALAILAFATFSPALAQQPIGIIKFDVSRTTVYRGYQWVEVVAYVYTGEDTPAPTISKANAVLTAGISLTIPMSLVTLYTPTTVTIEGKEYTVSYLLMARVFVPESAYTGKGSLKVEIEGKAAGQSFTFTKTVDLEIADHRPVDAAKAEALVALGQVRAVVTLASALGVDVSGFTKELSTIESSVSEATTRLEVYGEVDEAMDMYRAATASLATLQAKVVSALAVRYGSLESKVSSMNASLTQTIKSVEDLSKNLATSVKQLEDAIEKSSKASMDAVAAIATQLQDYTKKVDQSISALATSVDQAMKSLANATKSSTEKALGDIAAKVKTLDDNVVKLSQAQEDLARRVSDVANTLQISLIVVALMLLASVAVVRLLK
jgi:predicted  nucleic acid-binding Zn-ribbon protein